MTYVEDEMLKAKQDLTSRKKTLKTLKQNELDALKSGQVVEVERFQILQKILTSSCNAETNCKQIRDIKRMNFLKWRTNSLNKKKDINKLGNVIGRDTTNLYQKRIKMLVTAFDIFANKF